ncbi:MAG: PKD domain-containing protein [Bacteroidota bacterium]
MKLNVLSLHGLLGRFLCSILLALLCLQLAWAEGVKQLAPSEDDGPVMLDTGLPDFGYFADPQAPASSRLYVSIASTSETIYLGLSPEYDINGLPFVTGSLSAPYYRMRIRQDLGLGVNNPIVHPASPNRDWFTVNDNNANVNSWSEAEFGQYDTTTTQFGESMFIFKPNAVGDYYIEIEEFIATDNSERVAIPFWDITVAENGQPIPGRLWSRNWGLRTPNVVNGVADPCIWNKNFNGQFYSYTEDGFVSRIDFDGSEMQALSFVIAFNSSGPGNTGNLTEDRKSVFGQNLTQNGAEHRIFLQEPDPDLFPDGFCGELNAANEFDCLPGGEFCLPVAVTKPGQVQIVLDFDRNNQLDDNGRDTALIYNFTDLELSACVPWDGRRADGSLIDFNDTINLLFNYSQGVQHWSAFDLEILSNGFCVETIRPACAANSGTSSQLYWDDRNIPASPGNGSEKDGRDGCPCETGCRSWNNFDIGVATCEEWQFDSTTTGYGDKSTLNSWWFANNFTSGLANIPLVTIDIGGPDTICLGTTATYAALNVEGTGQISYSWSGPGFSPGQFTDSTVVVRDAGEYCVTIRDEIDCAVTTCQTLVTVDNSNDVVEYPDEIRACLGDTISLTPAGQTGNSTYAWSPVLGLDDPLIPDPSLVVTQGQTYIVTISAGEFVCTFTDTVRIEPYTQPIASFDFAFGCNSLDYSFASQSQFADSVFWDFGVAGSVSDVSSEQNPSFIFPEPGNYLVRLEAYGEGGCLDVTETTIAASDFPPIDLEVSLNGSLVQPGAGPGNLGNQLLICDPTAVISPEAEPDVSFVYLDESGSQMGTGASLTIDQAGDYVITIVATNADGCVVDQTISFAYGPVTVAPISATFGCNRLDYSFSAGSTGADSLHWDFGVSGMTTDVSQEAAPDFIYPEPGVYTVTFSAFSDEGCSASTDQTITVTDDPSIGLTVSLNGETIDSLGGPGNLPEPMLICSPEAVLEASAEADVNFIYQNEDGQTVGSGPNFTAPQPGLYQLTVIASDSEGCLVDQEVAFAYGPVTVSPIEAAFGCNRLAYDFTATSTGADSLHWDFGVASTTDDASADENPSFTYPAPGNYTVVLSVFSDEGCIATQTRELAVTDDPAIDMVVSLNGQQIDSLEGPGNVGDPILVCSPTAVLSAAAEADVDFTYMDENGQMLGSGGSFTAPAAGSYQLTVVASDSEGCSVEQEVAFDYGPVEIVATADTFGCNSLGYSFTSQTLGADNLLWDFGVAGTNEDQSNEANPSYTYTEPGTYEVQLFASSDEGCLENTSFTVIAEDFPPIDLAFNVNGEQLGPDLGALGTAQDPLLVCDPQAVIIPMPQPGTSFTYFDEDGNELGSGPLYQLPDPGSYVINVLAEDEDGCQVDWDIHLDHGPVESIQTDTAQSCNRREITFSSQSIGADSLFWDFGDPTTAADGSTANPATYTYPQAGTYLVQLWAFSELGCVDRTTASVVVVDTPAINLQVQAAFVNVGPEPNPADLGTPLNPVVLCTPTAQIVPQPRDGVSFGYYDTDGELLGEGASYQQALSGQHDITVLATDEDGCEIDMEVAVAGGLVDISAQDTIIGCLGSPVSLPVINLDSNDVLQYAWTPGELLDVPTSGSPIFEGPPGVYDFTATATSQYGCVDSVLIEATVLDETQVLDFTSEVECDGQTVTFTNTSTATFGYMWNFGDGEISTEANPVHVYEEEGEFTVTLDLIYEQDCIRPVVYDVTVDAIQLAAGYDVVLGDCADSSMTLQIVNQTINNTGNDLAYDWDFSAGVPNMSNQPSPMLTITETGPIDINLTVLSADGCSSNYDTTITASLPVVNVPDEIVICPGDTAFLNPDFDAELSYEWLTAPDFDEEAPNPGTVVAGTYVVAATTTAFDINCITYDTVVVRDGLIPELSVSSEAGLVDTENDGMINLPDPLGSGDMIGMPILQTCGEPISLTANAQGGTSFSYTRFPENETSAGGSITYNLNPRDTIVVVVEAISVDGCLSYDTLALFSAEIGVDPILAEVTACAELDTVLAVDISGNTDGVIYQWEGDNIIGPLDSSSIDLTVGESGPLVYSVSVTNAAGCTDETSVQLNITPFTPNRYQDTVAACYNEQTLLPGEPTVIGYQYDWSPMTGLDLSDPNQPMVTLTQDQTYEVLITDPNTGCQWTEVIFVDVQADIGLVLSPSDTLLCVPGTVTFTTALQIENADIVWFADPELTDILGAGPTLEYFAAESGDVTVYVMVVDKQTNCVVVDQASIVVDPVDDSLPTGAISACANDASTWNLFPDGMNPDYHYAFEPMELVDEEGNFIGIDDATTFVTTTDLATGCFVVDTVEVTYTDFADVTLTTDLEVIIIPNEVELTVNGCADCDYFWTTDNGTISPDDEAIAYGMPDFTDEVTYEVEVSKNGCSEVLFRSLPVFMPNCDEFHVFIPNAFSPNGDNQNDVLRVRSQFIDQGLLQDFEWMIYNRWGQEILHTRNPLDFWDGTFQGDPVEPDNFGYYLRVVCPDGQELVQQGSVTVLR